jgi:hypothetical protein
MTALALYSSGGFSGSEPYEMDAEIVIAVVMSGFLAGIAFGILKRLERHGAGGALARWVLSCVFGAILLVVREAAAKRQRNLDELPLVVILAALIGGAMWLFIAGANQLSRRPPSDKRGGD